MKHRTHSPQTARAGGSFKSSRRRDAVIRVFSAADEHLTVDELYDRVRKVDPKVGYTTVWRTLKRLESEGLAASRKFHDGHTRYERVSPEEHHDHLICIGCGHVDEFINPTVEELQQRIAATHKFTMTAHKMELYGYCRRCCASTKRKTARAAQT